MLILAGNSEGLSEVGKVSGPDEAAFVTGVGATTPRKYSHIQKGSSDGPEQS